MKFANLQTDVTGKIIAALEKGVLPWRKQHCSTQLNGFPRNAITGRPYNGGNAMLLLLLAQFDGQPPLFLTFNQAREHGGSVRKGEKGVPVYFFKKYPDRRDPDKEFLAARVYYVFNISQTEGVKLPRKMQALLNTDAGICTEADRIEACEDFVGKTEARIDHVDDPCYVPALDVIHIPAIEAWKSAEGYYSVLFHELTHWTGRKDRCDRILCTQYGSQDYAREELTAELGAAFLCAQFGIDNLGNNSAYISEWLKRLRGDHKFIFDAARDASKAVAFLNAKAGIDNEPDEEEEEEPLALAA